MKPIGTSHTVVSRDRTRIGYLSVGTGPAVLVIPGVLSMHIVGVIEMAVGAALLAGFTQIGGYVVAAWLVAIAINLVTTGRYFDVAVRDVAMAIAGFTLARLTEAGVAVEASSHAATSTGISHAWRANACLQGS